MTLINADGKPYTLTPNEQNLHEWTHRQEQRRTDREWDKFDGTPEDGALLVEAQIARGEAMSLKTGWRYSDEFRRWRSCM